MVSVVITPDAEEQFKDLPKAVRARIMVVLERLARWPEVSGVKPLRGEMSGSYRIRTGDYRVVFRTHADVITVTRIGIRRDVYED
ncbi:MAG: type II toxin-antitoxin system RelE family toxin [Phycisphaerae bacterium]